MAVLGINELRTADKNLVAKRLNKLNITEAKAKLSKVEKKPGDILRNLLKWAGGLSVTRRLGKSIDEKLEEADILLKGSEFIAVVFFIVFIAMLFVFSITLNILLSIMAGILFGIIPFLILNNARAKRLINFNAQIGDALTIMANSMRSGFSFIQSMDMVRKELTDPIRKEFDRTLREIKLGTPTEEAMVNMAKRVNSEDLDLVITAVLIQRQVGGNLSEVLDTIAGEIRDRIRIKREIKTLTAQGRISGTIIGLLPVFLICFILTIKPDYLMDFVRTKTGILMLFAAFVGEVIGMMLIKKIVDIRF